MTVRLSTSMMFQTSLKSMLETQNNVNRAQIEISTGKKILSAADDPAASAAISRLNETKERTEQYLENADSAFSQLGFQETMYGDMTGLLQRVRDLTIQGSNDTTTQADRRIIAEEIDELRGGLVSMANSKDINGNYLFAGNRVDTIPFSESGNVVSYQGDEGIRELKIGTARSVAINDNGKDVFMKVGDGNGTFSTTAATANTGTGVIGVGSDVTGFVKDTYSIQFTAADSTIPTLASYEVYDSAAALVAGPVDFESGDSLSFAGINVKIEGDPLTGDSFTIEPSKNSDIFSTLQSIIDTFRDTGDTPEGNTQRHNTINNAFSNLDNTLDNISVLHARAGTRLNTTEQQQEVNSNLIYQGEVNISRLEDVDMVEAIMEFEEQLRALQATQQSFSSMQQTTLFDFM